MNNEFDNIPNGETGIKQSKKQGYNIAIIVLLVLILIVGVIILLDMKGYSIFNKDNSGDKNNDEQSNTIEQSELEAIIAEELWILGGKNNINEITNHDKLEMAKRIYCNNSTYFVQSTCYKDKANTTELTTFTFDDINTIYEKTSISNLGNLKAENIKCSTDTHDVWIYDNQTKAYSITPDGHGANTIEPLYEKLINFNNDGSQYTISYKYVWTVTSESVGSYELYSSYDVSTKNYITRVEFGPEEGFDVEDYMNNNFETMKDKLDTYNYVFKKTNGKIELVNFYIN